MQRILLILILCAMFAAPSPADEMQAAATVRQRVELAEDGTAVVTTRIEGLTPVVTHLRIPVNTSDIDGGVTVDLPWVTAEIISADGVRFCELTASEGRSFESVTLVWRTGQYHQWREKGAGQFGAIALQYKFLNTSMLKVGAFTGEFVLPAGYIVQTIRKTEPAEIENSANVPYRAKKAEGRHSLSIDLPDMTIGDVASLSFTARKEEQPILISLICGIIAILYLAFFRDVLKPGGVGE